MKSRPETRPDNEGMNLERFVPALVIFIANRLTSTGSATYRKKFGIGALDFRVMAMLAIEPGASGARICEVIDLDKSAVSRTLVSLAERGLVTMQTGQGRAQSHTLTSVGRRIYDKAWLVSQERERLLLSSLSPQEQETLRKLLRRVLASMPLLISLSRNSK